MVNCINCGQPFVAPVAESNTVYERTELCKCEECLKEEADEAEAELKRAKKIRDGLRLVKSLKKARDRQEKDKA